MGMNWRVIDVRGRILDEFSGWHARSLAVLGKNFYNDADNKKDVRLRYKRPVRAVCVRRKK